jgi:hypothetical protein
MDLTCKLSKHSVGYAGVTWDSACGDQSIKLPGVEPVPGRCNKEAIGPLAIPFLESFERGFHQWRAEPIVGTP